MQFAALALYVIAMLIMLPVLSSSAGSHVLAQVTPIPTLAPIASGDATAPSADEVRQLIAWAERVSQSAADSISSANTVLGAIQALGVLITGVTIVIAVVAGYASYAGYRRVSELEEDLDARADNIRDDTDERADAFETRLDRRADGLETRLDKRINELTDALKKIDLLQQKLTPYESKLATFNEKSERLEKLENDVTTKLQQLEKESKDSLEALNLLQLGLKEFSYRNRELAIQHMRKAYELSPDNQAVTYILGELLTRTSKVYLKEGVTKLEAALKHDPDNPSVNAALGYAYRVSGDLVSDDEALPEELREEKCREFYKQALTCYERARSYGDSLYDITGESAFGGLAGLYKRQRQLPAAIYWYEKIANSTPGRSYPLNNLALLYDEIGDNDKALEQFRRAKTTAERILLLDPFDYWSCFDMITAGTALNLPAEVGLYLKHLFNLTPSQVDIGKLIDGLKSLRSQPDRDELRERTLKAVEEWSSQLQR